MRAVQQYPRKDRSHTCMFSGWTYTVLLKILLFTSNFPLTKPKTYIQAAAPGDARSKP